MPQIAGVKFKECGPVYYFDAQSLPVREGDWVIVKTEEGQGLGYISQLTDTLPEDLKSEDLKEVLRQATDEDMEKAKDNISLGHEAFQYCQKRIADYGLDMKLVDVEVYFDRSKVVFFFSAPGRVDFRELVKELVKEYKTRIELRQIGVRHETQMIGAVGNCGQICCCRRFLRRFDPVTIKMAKDQNLFLNPSKISGVCGRLLCCLAYEEDNYLDFKKELPKMGKRYHTEEGIMRVLRSNMFRNSLTVQDEESEEREIFLEEWKNIVRSQCTSNPEQNNKSGGNGEKSSSGYTSGNGPPAAERKKNTPDKKKGKPGKKNSGKNRAQTGGES